MGGWHISVSEGSSIRRLGVSPGIDEACNNELVISRAAPRSAGDTALQLSAPVVVGLACYCHHMAGGWHTMRAPLPATHPTIIPTQ